LKAITILVLLFTFNVFAFSSEVKSVEVVCNAELTKKENYGLSFIGSSFSKDVKVLTFGKFEQSKSLNMVESVYFDSEHSLEISLSESFSAELGRVILQIKAKLFRHRVGNGKVLIGESSRGTDMFSNYMGGSISLRVFNNYDFISNSSVVKDAFIECTTL
jgi:hypothetical protein